MPPRKQASTSKPTLFQHFVRSLPQDIYEQQDESALTKEQIRRAYALETDAESDHYYTSCSNIYAPVPVPAAVPAAASTFTPVLVLDSDGEEDDDPVLARPTSLSSKAKGKGKMAARMKGKERATSISSCSLERCANNPKCLNYLGQDRWEHISKPFR